MGSRVLQATKEQKGRALHIRLTGVIDEHTNFEELIGPPPGELVVHCKDVLRINSVGVKLWIKYFQTCSEKGTKLTFTDCSPAIVEQINLVYNFTFGGTIESIVVPFVCTSCRTELLGAFKVEDLKKIQLKIPDLKCTKCGGKAEFDDLPDVYLGFLSRK